MNKVRRAVHMVRLNVPSRENRRVPAPDERSVATKEVTTQTFQMLPARRFLKQDDVRFVSGHLGSGPRVGDETAERHHADGSPLLACFLPPGPGRVSEAGDRSGFLNKQDGKSGPQRQHDQAPTFLPPAKSQSGQDQRGHQPTPGRHERHGCKPIWLPPVA